MDQGKLAKEQLIHIVLGSVFFVLIAVAAVALDLLAKWVGTLGVDSFTTGALEIAAHVLLVIDLVLFFVYIFSTSMGLIKGMKP
ncbi:MAG: hypothetical protein EPN72_15160 [Nevskiaceae bacterium]|nr:MAG: hypothetical protein EPN63_14355 [Nevskiaceae bacterium]TBR71223.1 MAG: hypothetical protein EPN72_15160 [Nevskiaceae bacterium]